MAIGYVECKDAQDTELAIQQYKNYGFRFVDWTQNIVVIEQRAPEFDY